MNAAPAKTLPAPALLRALVAIDCGYNLKAWRDQAGDHHRPFGIQLQTRELVKLGLVEVYSARGFDPVGLTDEGKSVIQYDITKEEYEAHRKAIAEATYA